MKTPTPKIQYLSSTQWVFIFQSKEKPRRCEVSPLTVRVFPCSSFHFSTALSKDRGKQNKLYSLIISEKSPEPVDIICHGVNGSHGRCTIRTWACRKHKEIIIWTWHKKYQFYAKFISLILSLFCIRTMLLRECMFLGSLSHHNKNLEWRTLKPLGGSQLSDDRSCYSS